MSTYFLMMAEEREKEKKRLKDNFDNKAFMAMVAKKYKSLSDSEMKKLKKKTEKLKKTYEK